jgi:hypothetical protein
LSILSLVIAMVSRETLITGKEGDLARMETKRAASAGRAVDTGDSLLDSFIALTRMTDVVDRLVTNNREAAGFHGLCPWGNENS